MKKITRLMIFIVLSLLALSGCRRGYDSQLLAVEELMRVDRDSAIVMLTRFEERGDTSHLSEPDSHLYQLLRAQSRYYTDITDTVNPGLEEACAYFEKNKDWNRSAESRLLLGIQCQETMHFTDGIVHEMWAARWFATLGDTLGLARVSREQGSAFENLNDLASAIRYHYKAYVLFRHMNDTVYYPWELVSLTSLLKLQDNLKEAEKTGLEVCRIGKKYNNKALRAEGFRIMLDLYQNMDSNKKAILYFDSLQTLGKEFVRPYDIENLGIAAFGNDDLPLARACLDSVKGKECTGNLQQIISIYDKDYYDAIEEIKKITDHQNSRVIQIWSRDMATIIDEYYGALIRENEKENRLHNYRLTVVLFLCGAGILASIMIVMRRFRKYRREREYFHQLNGTLKDQIQLWTERSEQDKNVIRKYEIDIRQLVGKMKENNATWAKTHEEELSRSRDLLRETSRVMNMELLRFIGDFDGLRNKNKSARIEEMMESFIESLKSKAALTRCIRIADRAYDNIIEKFDTTFPNLPDHTRRLFVYNVLQLPSALQCMLLGNIEGTKLRNRKSYLRHKITASGGKNSEEFIYFLS